jgi:hypothetical protein
VQQSERQRQKSPGKHAVHCEPDRPPAGTPGRETQQQRDRQNQVLLRHDREAAGPAGEPRASNHRKYREHDHQHGDWFSPALFEHEQTARLCQKERRGESRRDRRLHIADQTRAEDNGGKLGIAVVTGQELARYGEQQA